MKLLFLSSCAYTCTWSNVFPGISNVAFLCATEQFTMHRQSLSPSFRICNCMLSILTLLEYHVQKNNPLTSSLISSRAVHTELSKFITLTSGKQGRESSVLWELEIIQELCSSVENIQKMIKLSKNWSIPQHDLAKQF